MSETDKLLKNFDYRAALDSVLRSSYIKPSRVIGVIVELARRDGLKFALSNRDANGIIPMLDFLVRYENI